MVELSMQAALLIYMTSFFLGLILILLYGFYMKDQTLWPFLIFFLLSIVATVLIFFRTEINNSFISIIFANFLHLVSNIFLLYGVVGLLHKKIHLIFISTLCVLFVLFFTYFTYFDNDVVARIIVFNLFMLTIMFRILQHLVHYKKFHGGSSELMTPVIIIIMVSVLLRIIGVIVFRESTNSFLHFTRDSLNISLVGISYLLTLVGLFSLLRNEVTKTLEESEIENELIIKSCWVCVSL